MKQVLVRGIEWAVDLRILGSSEDRASDVDVADEVTSAPAYITSRSSGVDAVWIARAKGRHFQAIRSLSVLQMSALPVNMHERAEAVILARLLHKARRKKAKKSKRG